MSEIWNLSTLCRCCHSDGCFKSLNLPYEGENGVELYECMLHETFGVKISTPPLEASYTICDSCILRLRDASQFRQQVLTCEQKFQVYCTNEQFLLIESVKSEIDDTNDNATNNIDVFDDNHEDDDMIYDNIETIPNIDDEKNLNEKLQGKISKPNTQNDRNITISVKEEITAETDIKPSLGDIKEIIPNDEIIKDKDAESDVSPKVIEIDVPKFNCNNKSTRCQRAQSFITENTNGNNPIYTCKVCHNEFKSKLTIIKHIRTKHCKRTLYECEQCEEKFKFLKQYNNHMSNKHKKGGHICKICGKDFKQKYNLIAHENTHSTQMYECNICHKKLRHKSTLKKHIQVMHTNEPRKKKLCDICGWSFNDKSNLEVHIRTVHLKQRPFACPVCGKTYTAKKHVKGHMITAHSENNKPHECQICTKRFSCMKSLKIHIDRHDNNFKCRFCSIIFDNKKDYDSHLKTHVNEAEINSPHICPLCGKVLLTKFTLNRHIEIHEGIKRYSCDICGFKVSQKSQLTRHKLRKHNPNIKTEKTKCDLCKKMVVDLQKHMEVHSVEGRKYFCDICGKCYPENNTLTRHRNQKHFGKTFNCDICGKSYLKRKALENHRIKIHKIKMEKSENEIEVLPNIEVSIL